MDHTGGQPPADPVHAEHGSHGGGKQALAMLTLGALGIVYGDIGTSPLYAIKECFHEAHGVAVSHANVLGVLSLIFWALMFVISTKYMVFVMRADNKGEGGILALMSLALSRRDTESGRLRTSIMVIGLFGAALLYGDGMITPAISVLSAVEGLGVATSRLEPYVLYITILILAFLFMFQRHGTAKIGQVFGPVILTWFCALALLGIWGIIQNPAVLLAISPHYAVQFFLNSGWQAFVVLGSVFLVQTGGEALYADMGHFGRSPIRLGWFTVALPGLLLNYFGQGAHLMAQPEAATNPFYHLIPGWALYPMVALATIAAIIASQAVISGAFSLTRQAVQLGYFPRIPIIHTSSHAIGQIYIPIVNALLFLATVALVLGFGNSSNLAAAYGVSVTMTMVITTVLLYVVARHVWGWRRTIAIPLMAAFFIVDVSFFGATILKISHGGWFPLVVGLSVYAVMSTWRRGRQILGERLQERILPLEGFAESIALAEPHRVAGAAVYMSGNPHGTPPVLLHNLKHNKVLHEIVVFLTFTTEEVPHIPAEERVEVKAIGNNQGFYRVLVRYGFMESPNVPEVLDLCKAHGLHLNIMTTTFFLGRETLIPSKRPGMVKWRERLFAFLSRNAQTATAFFEIPPGQVVELGVRVEL